MAITGESFTTLLRLPRMISRSGVWLEGWSKREAQTFLLALPWIVFVASLALHALLFVVELKVRSSATFVQDVEEMVHIVLIVVLLVYLVGAVVVGLCLCLLRCRSWDGPRRTVEGWLALLPLAVCVACSYGYLRGRHSADTQETRHSAVLVHGDWAFHLASTGEFALQLAWNIVAECLGCEGQLAVVSSARRLTCFVLVPLMWLLTFAGPKDPTQHLSVSSHVVIGVGDLGRLILFADAVRSAFAKCAGYVGCFFPLVVDKDTLRTAPHAPGRLRLHHLLYNVMCRPSFLILVNLPLGFPLAYGATFAWTLRCFFALLLAVVLRPAPRSAMEMHDLERDTRGKFDLALAMRMCDFAYEVYHDKPLPESVLVLGCRRHTWLNGEYLREQQAGNLAGELTYAMRPDRYLMGSEVQNAYLRQVGARWELCTYSGEEYTTWAFVEDTVASPALPQGEWQERASPGQFLRNASLRCSAVGSRRRFEHHASSRAEPGQPPEWLFVEEEGPLVAVPLRAAAGTGAPAPQTARRAGDLRLRSMRSLLAPVFAGGGAPPSQVEPTPADGIDEEAGGPVDEAEVSIVLAFRGTRALDDMRSNARFQLQSLAEKANYRPGPVDAASPGEGRFDLGQQVQAEVEERCEPPAGPGRPLLGAEAPGGDAPAAQEGGCPIVYALLQKCCFAVCRLAVACLCAFCFPFETSSRDGDDRAFGEESYLKARVHVGFFDRYAKHRQEILAMLERRLHECEAEGKRARVYVTGHSLGGALACLCALDLATMNLAALGARESAVSVLHRPVVYTFGAPRVGNAAFRSLYNVLVPDTFRVVASRDIVATLPPSGLGYRQLGREVWLDDAGEVTLVMSWAMRHILPPRDCLADHRLKDSYFDLLGRAFLRAGGQERPPIRSIG